ncbi:MAG: YraN family protein [Nitrospira sp.]|nr:YraN family protein [Nitrospira sp.]
MRLLGSEGETFAVAFLEKRGYKIISRNYKTPIGEIDIIAQDGNTIVFVEVKTRKDESLGKPFEAVNKKKQQKLKNLALFYLKARGKEYPVRFDVLSILYGDDKKKHVEHIKDAFEV